MGKYNEKDNDDYLVRHTLLGMDTFEDLEEAEALVFSLRATELEQGEHTISSFPLEGFQDLHR
ncbi:hypothetical protein [Bacillus piscicola]|uniref:hypothetical protein n=1 Tax=Bacillus piscicola TaxID=1632684 RepID=UPI001F090EC7|nr:hypothetical protein [Bacillus piscicola]